MAAMKICISGAGIAGPSLAHWLLRLGHDCTLVESAPQFRRGGYIMDFWGRGFDLSERMGLLPQVLAAGYRVREVRLVDELGRKVGGFPAENLYAGLGGRFVSLPRGELAGLIFDSVKDQVETLFGDSITAVRDTGAEVEVDFASAPPRRFDLLIGADGLHSKVRALAFPPGSWREVFMGFQVAAFEVPGYRPREELVYLMYSRPGLQAGRFAMHGDRTMLLLIFASEQPAEAHSVQAQKALLRERFAHAGWECREILAAMDDCDSIYFDRVSQLHAQSWTRGRVALVGDAACAPSLLAGQGSSLAMLGAYVLAGELASSAGDHARAFAAYQQRLRPFMDAKQSTARRFASQFLPKTELGLWARRWVTNAMRIPGVANLVLARTLRDSFELPDYALPPAGPGAKLPG